ncbi:MAG: ATP-dependent sacrificial sulfur transferase LarE [Ignavibacteriales bacterium]|nr:ATP-dependent sacrificial sulfur transferase LarE [Ignavibacteriales bacterium]
MTTELNNKYHKLQSLLIELKNVVIGFSGGVDSTLLLKVAVDTLGKNVLAVIGRSETYPQQEYKEALELVNLIGAKYLEVNTEETDNIKFRENPIDRCYYCKTELFSKLHQIAVEYNIKWIADGSIVDDLNDFRPGSKASKEQNVRSPLLESGFTKEDVRELSKHLGLPTWDKPSFACLSSRFPYGFGITKEALRKVDEAESFIRSLGFCAFRVRHHDEKTARIEILPTELPKFLEDELRKKVIDKLKSLGFIYITLDLQGYRTGSMNEVLPEEVKKK